MIYLLKQTNTYCETCKYFSLKKGIKLKKILVNPKVKQIQTEHYILFLLLII